MWTESLECLVCQNFTFWINRIKKKKEFLLNHTLVGKWFFLQLEKKTQVLLFDEIFSLFFNIFAPIKKGLDIYFPLKSSLPVCVYYHFLSIEGLEKILSLLSWLVSSKGYCNGLFPEINCLCKHAAVGSSGIWKKQVDNPLGCHQKK